MDTAAPRTKIKHRHPFPVLPKVIALRSPSISLPSQRQETARQGVEGAGQGEWESAEGKAEIMQDDQAGLLRDFRKQAHTGARDRVGFVCR